MKLICVAALLFAVPMLSVPAKAKGTIKQADYPVEYEVVNSGKASKLAVEKECSITLRDRAKPNVEITVMRSHHIGSCQVLESGKIYNGRQNDKKNQLELVIVIGDDKARIENWQIVGVVTAPSSSTPTPNSK